MKTLFIILAASLLTACGGGAMSTPMDSKAYSTQSIEANVESFSAKAGGSVIVVEGQGVTRLDRQYDAVAYVASIQQSGSDNYRAMMSDNGLIVTLVSDDGVIVSAVVRLLKDGMHISM